MFSGTSHRWAAILGVMMWTGVAQAAPKSIVVLPFDSSTEIKYELPVAVELALELSEYVVVKSRKRTWAALKNRRDEKYSSEVLSRVMGQRNIDIVVTGKTNGDSLTVVAYGRDGKMRVKERFDYPDDLDATADSIVARLDPFLATWDKLDPIATKKKKKKKKRRRRREPEPEPEDAPDDDDLFVDDIGDKPAKKKKKTAKKKRAQKNLGDDKRERKATRRRDQEDRGRKRKRLDNDDDDDAAGLSFDDEPDDDDDDEDAAGLSFDDDDPAADDEDEDRRVAGKRKKRRKKKRRRKSLKDRGDGGSDEEDAEAHRLHHYVAVSVAPQVASWILDFAGNNDAQSSRLVTSAYGGGALHFDAFYKYIGGELDISGGAVNFCAGQSGIIPFSCTEDPAKVITPKQFIAWRTAAAATLRARYYHEFRPVSVAAGGRLGYRFAGAFVDDQKSTNDGLLNTAVAGFQWHQLTLGAEVFAAFVFLKNRVETELQVDVVPAVPPYSLFLYSESPDSPGLRWWVAGGLAKATVRVEVFMGIFVKAQVLSSLAWVQYDGEGTRRTTDFEGRNPEIPRGYITGGRLLNLDIAGNVGVGYMF